MEVTTKELRIQPGKIIEQVVHGEEVTVTFRGKALARIVPVGAVHSKNQDEIEIFGMWKNSHFSMSVDDTVRDLRKGRSF
jgi:prevent-host-death family protein